MKTLECSRCHRLFKTSDVRIFIHTNVNDLNWCSECTRRAIQLMNKGLNEEENVKLNFECMKCPLKAGCLTLCATQPEDVINPPCNKYAIGITGNHNDAFWTRPSETYVKDRLNTNPADLRFVIVSDTEKEESAVVIL